MFQVSSFAFGLIAFERILIFSSSIYPLNCFCHSQVLSCILALPDHHNTSPFSKYFMVVYYIKSLKMCLNRHCGRLHGI